MPKFTTIDLGSSFNRSRNDATPWEEPTAAAIIALPGSEQRFWGVPFILGAQSGHKNGLVVAGAESSRSTVIIPVDAKASYLVLAHFCDSRAATSVAGQTSDYADAIITAPGEHLADYTLLYGDGTEERVAIRRRFEINQVMTQMLSGFLSRHHQDIVSLDIHGPYWRNMWGPMQTGVFVGEPGPTPDGPTSTREFLSVVSKPPGSWSIYALSNPHPARLIVSLRVEPTGAAAIAIGGLTLFTGAEHPLRHRKLETVAIDLPNGTPVNATDIATDIDLGIIARRYLIQSFNAEEWMSAVVKGWGEIQDNGGTSLALDITAALDATLSVDGRGLDVRPLFESGQAASADGQVVGRVLTPTRTWVKGRIIDGSTGEATAARVHFRSADGRYFPPYGHRHEVNDNWFEDYGADLRLGDTPYAYIDGHFEGELPVGEVYAEISKGFEFETVRAKLDIAPGQSELTIELNRIAETRADGWITADTHVHFLSPETARLEAAAEDINVVNLLAAQWGDLYTNVGDLTGAMSGSSTDETIVWVGSENRQHFLGHISLLGATGSPIFPMSTGGPGEGYIGDPTALAMSEWADRAHAKSGLVIVPHFPFPHSEVIADVVNGKVDGLEIRDFWTPTMDTFAVREWYRLLNCGYRVAVVGGTDKMSAGMPLGGVRTYANIGDEDLSHESWARAVRDGRTYTTSGPIMSFTVEGLAPGDELQLPKGGGSVSISASCTSAAPVNLLQIVFNGNVIAQTESLQGANSLSLTEQPQLPASGWLAARAISDHKAWHEWPVHFAAHTSPVYVVAGKQEIFDSDLGEYLITTMQGGLEWLDTLATRDTPERHATIKKVFEVAIAEVRDKQRRHAYNATAPDGAV